jgi:hypothetical protein
MKTHCILLIATACHLASLALAAEAPATPARAHLASPLADGTPPAPEPEKPKFIVRSKNVLSRETHFEGGRKITVQEITPIDLPQPPEALTPQELSPAIRELMAQRRAAHAKKIHLPLSAIIYRSATSAPRTLVTYSPPPEITATEKSEQTVTQAPSITFWSSADFTLLTGFADFIGSDGQTRSLMLAWSTYDLEPIRARAQKFRKPGLIPTIPPLPEGPATFLITRGSPRPQDLAAIQSLHDLYNNELPRLQAAYQGRERLRLAQEAEQKAHPPQPQDLILNHWRTPTDTAPQKGAAK